MGWNGRRGAGRREDGRKGGKVMDEKGLKEREEMEMKKTQGRPDGKGGEKKDS